MRRKGLYILTFFVTLSFALINSVSADVYQYYFDDPVVPQQEKLDIKNSLLVDHFSGAAVYNHPIKVPPGTNGLQPILGLSYNSHGSKDRPDVVGAGWSITESYVQRDVNNSFVNISDDNFVLLLNGLSYELVYSTLDGRYHSKVENFFFINKTSGGQNEKSEYWILKTKDGTSYRFGFYNFSEIVSNKYNYTSRWNLDLINDTYGNSIFYNYSENPYPSDKGVAYLTDIKYNNDLQRRIDFYYLSTDVPSLRTGYENGNLVSKSRMLDQIVINVSNKTVMKYVFSYRFEVPGNVTFVYNITEYGNDSVNSLPSTDFEYNPTGLVYGRTNWTHAGCNATNNTGCFVDISGVDKGVRMTELNGDGLVDLVKAVNGHTLAWLNNRTGWEPVNWSHQGCTPGYEPGCFLSGTTDIGGRLVDLDGNGLVDVLKAGGPVQETSAFLNNGTGWYTITWTFGDCTASVSDMGCFVDTGGNDKGVRLVDLNGDGLIDLFKAQYIGAGNVQAKAWLNNGTGFFPINWTHAGCNTSNNTGCFIDNSGNDLGTRIIDVNGDGLQDLVRTQYDTFLWLNNGTGWEQANWSHAGCFTGYSPGCFVIGTEDAGARLTDLNGDGLVDVLKTSPNQGTSAFLNNGTGWYTITWTFGDCTTPISIYGCFVTTSGQDMGTRLADLNGDGLSDIFRAQDSTGSGSIYGAWINNGYANYLLNDINLSLGGEIFVKYQKSTYLNNTGNDSRGDLDFNLWLVSNITTNNDIEGTHNTTSISFYNFSGGFYDYASKEFRGFSFTEEIIGDKIVKHDFHQDNGRVGKEFKTEFLDNQNRKYKTKEMLWNSTNQNGYYITTLVQDSESDYDNQVTPKIKNITYAYDTFGNLINKNSLGDLSTSSDDRFEYYRYVNNTNAWIVEKISNYSLLDYDNSTLLRNTLSYYDNAAFGSSPTKGELNKKENLVNSGNKITNLFAYNSFGNLINSTDPNGKVTKYGYGTRDTTNTFPDNITNSKNQTTHYFYDLGTGNLFSDKDSNGLSKNYTYDSLAIEKTTLLPLDTSSLPTQEYSYDFTTRDEGKIIVKQREKNNTVSTLDTYKFYDGLGRLIQTKTEAPNSRQIVIDIYYDEFGRVKEQTNPYFVTADVNYSAPNTTIKKTKFTYDILDRIVKITNADSSFKNISYNRGNVTVIDENGNKKEYVNDAFGRIIKIIEFNSSQSYVTKYSYDGADNLISIIDSLNNTFNYTYDSLGRKTQEKDPDRGIWRYNYDLNGNLIGQIDNRNISMNYSYDSLNRKIDESSQGNIINYFYDVDLNNTLSDVSANFSVINYSYDDRLRKVTEEINISGKRYSSIWSYDSADRVVSQIMPDGRVLNFTYNEQGLLFNISDIGAIDYNENNNPLNISYGNNLVTNYIYNSSNLRLTKIKTSGKQELSYIYDSLGNVLNISDAIHYINYSMTYDSLNRLTGTTTTGTYNIFLGFVYDQIGNIRNVTGTYAADYYYEDTKPHATSRVVFY